LDETVKVSCTIACEQCNSRDEQSSFDPHPNVSPTPWRSVIRHALVAGDVLILWRVGHTFPRDRVRPMGIPSRTTALVLPISITARDGMDSVEFVLCLSTVWMTSQGSVNLLQQGVTAYRLGQETSGASLHHHLTQRGIAVSSDENNWNGTTHSEKSSL